MRAPIVLGAAGVGGVAGWLLGAKWALVGGPVGALFGAAVAIIGASYVGASYGVPKTHGA